MSDSTEEFLSHYGVKGMRWGVRRPRGADGRVKQGPSKDSKRAKSALKKAKKSGVKALTNSELKDLNRRLNLEQEFSRLNPTTSKFQKGMSFTKEVLKVGNTANQAYTFAKSPVGQELAKAIKTKK